MAWRTIIDASSTEEAKAARPTIVDIPAGSKVRITVEFAWYMPIGKIGDLAGSELWVPKLLPYQLEVTDVYGDWHWFKIEGIAKGVGPAVLVIVICGIIAALGVAFCVTRWLMEAELTEQARVEAQREERRYEYVEWRASPEGGGATPEQAWAEVEQGAPPSMREQQTTSLFPDLFPTEEIGELAIGGMGLLLVLGLILFTARKE